MAIKGHAWNRYQTLIQEIIVKDSLKTYAIDFKFRNTSAYPFQNLWVLLKLNGPGLSKQLKYQIQVSDSTGMWIGKGSGDRFQIHLTLVKSFRFPQAGKYFIEVEHLMKDNPLIGVSDVGISILEN